MIIEKKRAGRNIKIGKSIRERKIEIKRKAERDSRRRCDYSDD